MADPAPSEGTAASSDKAPLQAEPSSTSDSAKVDGGDFSNTRQHVADRRAGDGVTERFVNTKLNIALINDPKRGPRFTLTKRESGVNEDESSKKSSDTAAKAEENDAAAPSALTENAQPTPSDRVAGQDNPPAKADVPAATVAVAEQPASPTVMPRPATAESSPAAVPSPTEPQRKVPIDSSKTFVGHNGNYYDESWRWMDWRGTKRSWNWPAALSFGHWFAYRRLYTFAGLHLLCLAGLAAATVNDIPILALIGVALLIIGLAGVYGNILYFRAFRRAAHHVTEKGEGSYDERRGQLASAGGTSRIALGIMGGLSLAGIASALAATYYMRGGFFFNFWPFF